MTVIQVTADADTPRVAPTGFKPFRCPYPEFNPVQSACIEFMEQDMNIVVDAPTASGKTLIAEMAAAVALAKGQTVLYASPLKALTEEKAASWAEKKHPFSGCSIVTLTSDYTTTPGLAAKLAKADIILCTSEMIDARSRLKNQEVSAQYLQKAGVLIVDEAHLLGSDKRGDRLEAGLMAITEANPKLRLIMLSATIRNATELARWSVVLNKRETVMVKSTWRPSKLNQQIEIYRPETESYSSQRKARLDAVVRLLNENRGDSTIVFVHSKKEGRLLVRQIEEDLGIRAEFHNADLPKAARQRIAREFLRERLTTLVATSTLAYGLNLPAKRVIICGVDRGRQEVDAVDVVQEVGRAGRPQFDPEGFAHVLVRQEQRERWSDLLRNLPIVRSQMAGVQRLRFHIVSLVDRGKAQTPEALRRWHARSLLALQGTTPTQAEAQGLYDLLKKNGVLRKKDGVYSNTFIGEIAAKLYFDPMAIAEWASNWKALETQKMLYDDAALAWAIGRSCNFERAFPSDDTRQAVGTVVDELSQIGLAPGPHGVTIAALYWYMKQTPIPELSPFVWTIRSDAWRLVSAWKWIARRAGLKTILPGYLEGVGVRIEKGASWDVADLCRITGIGPKWASDLVDEGIRSIPQFLGVGASNKTKRKTAIGVLGQKRYVKFFKRALEMRDKGLLTINKPTGD